MTTGLQNQQGFAGYPSQPVAYGQPQPANFGAPAPAQYAAGQPFQSVDMDSYRWKAMHGSAKASLIKLISLIGTNFPATEDEPNNGVLSNDDLLLNEDGTADLDFEESSIETLGEAIVESRKLTAILERFQYNLSIRPKPTEPTETPES